MVLHSQWSLCMVTYSVQLIVQRWSVASRSGLRTTDPYRIHPIDLEVRRPLDLLSCSKIPCWKLFLVLTLVCFLCASHICLHLLSLESWWGILISSSSTLIFPPKSSRIEHEAYLQSLLCLISELQLAYCQVLPLFHSWFVWWPVKLISLIVGGVAYVTRSVFAASMSGGSSLADLFRSFYCYWPQPHNHQSWIWDNYESSYWTFNREWNSTIVNVVILMYLIGRHNSASQTWSLCITCLYLH